MSELAEQIVREDPTLLTIENLPRLFELVEKAYYEDQYLRFLESMDRLPPLKDDELPGEGRW